MEMKGPISKTTEELVELCQQLRAIDMNRLKKAASPEQLFWFEQMKADCELQAIMAYGAERLKTRR